MKDHFYDTYRPTFLRAVDSRYIHRIKACIRVLVLQAVHRVAKVPIKVLHHGLSRTQHCYPLKEAHLCLLCEGQ